MSSRRMDILIVEHDPLDQPFRLGELLAERGHATRRVRIHLGEELPERIDAAALVSLGGYQNVDEAEQYPWLLREMALMRRAHAEGTPILGVCLGAQLLAEALGGKVERALAGAEIGVFDVERTAAGAADPLLSRMPARFAAVQCHAYEITRLPAQADGALARTAGTAVQAFRVGPSFGVQFHPEWTDAAVRAILDEYRQWMIDLGVAPDAVRTDVAERLDAIRSAGDRLLAAWIDLALG